MLSLDNICLYTSVAKRVPANLPQLYMWGHSLEPKPLPHEVLVQKSQHNEFCRVWIKELGLDKLSEGLHRIKEHTDKNKSHYVEISSGLRRLKI